jgi:dihydrofolate reductase
MGSLSSGRNFLRSLLTKQCIALLPHSISRSAKAGIQSQIQIQIRSLSVKELSWCAPKTKEDNKTKRGTTTRSPSDCTPCSHQMINAQEEETGAPKFGIIAALEETTRIIGKNGKLPWDIPEDRQYFMDVTRDKVMIIGRNTFFERSDFSHLRHLRHVIVVSSSLKETCHDNSEEEKLWIENGLQNDVRIARNFEEALIIGKECENLRKESKSGDQNMELSGDEIDCWVGGGQLLYEQAVRHPKATYLRLTVVHKETNIEGLKRSDQVAFFPAKYRWDNRFKEILDKKRSVSDDKVDLHYTFHEYKRR